MILFSLLIFFIFLIGLHKIRIPEIICIKRYKITEPSRLVFFITVKNFIIGCFKYLTYIFFPFFAHYSLPISGSMMPTYHIGDLIYTSPYTFNLHKLVPQSMRSFVKNYFPVLKIKEPKIGDCCIFFTPNSEHPFSKRIVALGGDTVYVNGHMLTINDYVCPLRFLRSEVIDDRGVKNDFDIYERTLPNGIKHEVAIPSNIPINNIHRSYFHKVPEGHAFMMGDNLYNSQDSVSTLGTADLQDVFAQIHFVIVRTSKQEIHHDSSWLNPFTWQFGVNVV